MGNKTITVENLLYDIGIRQIKKAQNKLENIIKLYKE